MKTKALALLLAICCTLSMAACGTSRDNESPSAAGEAREVLVNEFEKPEPEEEREMGEEPEEEPWEKEEPDEEAPEVKEESEEEEPESAEKPSMQAAQTPDKLSDNLYDFQISIDGTVYQFPMWYSEFEALGWEYDGDPTNTLSYNQYTLSEVWKKDGNRIYTRLANLSMNTVPFSESMVAGISLEKCDLQDCNWDIILPGGIQWGVSNVDDIIAAYGDPTYDYDGDMYYKMTYKYDWYREIKFYVYKEEGVLLKIEIENVVELEE